MCIRDRIRRGWQIMKKSKGIISLILTVVLIALLGFTTVVGFGKGQTGAAKNIKLGLDLEGGVSITYQVKGDTPSKEDMSDTIYKLQKLSLIHIYGFRRSLGIPFAVNSSISS